MQGSVINRHVEFVFNHAQVVAPIEKFLETIRDLVGADVHRFDWPVNKIDVPDVLAINIGQPYFS